MIKKMVNHIFKCQECGKYTMEERCSCGGKAITTRPPKYSPEDKYGKYRRIAKKEESVKRGLI